MEGDIVTSVGRDGGDCKGTVNVIIWLLNWTSGIQEAKGGNIVKYLF